MLGFEIGDEVYYKKLDIVCDIQSITSNSVFTKTYTLKYRCKNRVGGRTVFKCAENEIENNKTYQRRTTIDVLLDE